MDKTNRTLIIVRMKRIFNTIVELYWRCLLNPVDYARHLGVKVGNNCFIDIRHWGSEPYLITIGNNVGIAASVMIHCHGGGRVARRIIPNFDCFGKVVIEDWAYIGTGAQIMPGVTIGEGALVAAGSIVTKSVPPGMVVAGNPAKVICSVEDYVARNAKYNLNCKNLNKDEKRAYLLGLPDDKFIRK